MTERRPALIQKNPLDSSDVTGIEEMKDGETIGLTHGGTGATTADAARAALGLSDAELKSRYEGNPDTNAFTDADSAKLGGIEAGADATTGSNNDVAGSDAQVFDTKSGSNLAFRTLTAGSNIQLTQDADHIDVSVQGGAGSGLDSDRLDGAEGSSYLDADNHTDGTVNKVYTGTERVKLAGIDDGANKNSGRAINPAGAGQPFREVDAATDELLFRGIEAGDNVSVTQTSDLIKVEVTDADIETAYKAQVPEVTQAEAEAGTDINTKRWTAERVKQAIAALGGGAVASVNTKTGVVVLDPDDLVDTATTNKFTDAAAIAKLAGIEAGATADQTAAEILALLLTVDGFGSGLDADKLQGISGTAYVDTDNHTDGVTNRVYSAVDKTKLAGIEAGATADQTGAEIKTAYEAEANTNAFADADVTKLAGIEALAEKNDKITKSITVESPTGTEDISFFYAPVAITIRELVSVIIGATSVTWTLHHSTDRSLAGNKVVTAGSTTSNTTTGDVITTFDDATIPANSFVWLETSAIVGTPTSFFLSVEYTED